MSDNITVRQTPAVPYPNSGDATSQARAEQLGDNPKHEGCASQYSAIAIPSVPPVAVSPTVGVAKLFAKG